MINNISIIVTCDNDRVPLFLNTLQKYREYKDYYNNIEILIANRNFTKESQQKIKNINPFEKIYFHKYQQDGYNAYIKGLNICAANSSYNNILLFCPEVMPMTDAITQIRNKQRGNYIFYVYETNNNKTQILASSKYRNKTVEAHFFALFKKEDILDINGWDESMCQGYAHDDNDFGNRFTLLSKHKHEICDDIIGEHQAHPRPKRTPELFMAVNRNIQIKQQHLEHGVAYIKNGIDQYL